MMPGSPLGCCAEEASLCLILDNDGSSGPAWSNQDRGTLGRDPITADAGRIGGMSTTETFPGTDR
jgi:hypothetical protein